MPCRFAETAAVFATMLFAAHLSSCILSHEYDSFCRHFWKCLSTPTYLHVSYARVWYWGAGKGIVQVAWRLTTQSCFTSFLLQKLSFCCYSPKSALRVSSAIAPQHKSISSYLQGQRDGMNISQPVEVTNSLQSTSTHSTPSSRTSLPSSSPILIENILI